MLQNVREEIARLRAQKISALIDALRQYGFEVDVVQPDPTKKAILHVLYKRPPYPILELELSMQGVLEVLLFVYGLMSKVEA